MALAVSCLTVGVLVLSRLMCGGASLEPGFNFTVEPQDTIALKNKSVYLNCHATEVAGIVYSWRKDGQIIDTGSNRRATVLKNGTLLIKRVIHRKQRPSSDRPLRSDEGYYECLAKIGLHALVSRQAHLQVATLSRPSGEPRIVTAAVGEVARFHCSCHAFPRPEFKWWHNKGQIAPDDARYSMLDSGVLIIHGVVPEDDGPVRCSASNIANKSGRSREFHLTITQDTSSKPVRLLSHEQTLHPLVGESATLECTATGLPMPTPRWYHRNNSLVQESSRFSIRNGILRIASVQRSDSDHYQCTARQEGRSQVERHEVNLDVYEPPKLMTIPPHVEEKLSVTVRITCNFTGYPQPINVTWFKDGIEIYMNGRLKHRPTGSGEVFVIQNADLRDSGYYMCRGENVAGVIQYNIKVDMHSNEYSPDKPMKLSAESPSDTTIKLDWADTNIIRGQSLVAYSVHLLAQDVPNAVEIQKVATVSELEINDLKPNTNYSFYVVAYFSEAGASPHSEIIYQRTREGIPIAYPEVQVDPYGATSLMVRWEPLPVSKAQGVIVHHQILYRKHGSTFINVEDLKGEQKEYLILGLEPDTEYDVRVKSGTRVGYPDLDEKDWPWITIKTFPNSPMPEGLPQLTLRALNSTAVLVMWSGEVPEKIIAWKFTFTSANDVKKSKLRPLNTSNFTMTSLKPNSVYEVRLMPVFTDGEGEMVRKTIKTPGPGPFAPERLEAVPLNATCIVVNWHYPSPTDEVDHYEVRYNPVTPNARTGGSSQEMIVTSDSLEKMIGQLEPYTQYELAVRAAAVKAHGLKQQQYGPFSKKVQCRTKATFPEAPNNFQAYLKNPGAIMLQWQPPSKSNGLIVAYNVMSCDRMMAPDKDWSVKVLNGTTTKILMQELKVGTTYYFKVQALTELGAGPATDMHQIYIPNTPTSTENPPGKLDGPSADKNKEMGIIVGVSISGVCIIACIIIILFRNRCFPREAPADSSAQHEGTVCVRANGNGYVPHGDGVIHMPNESHEMDSITPLFTHIPENENSDSKGGYGIYPNNPAGVGLRATYMPNGHVTTFVTRQRPDDQDDSPQVPLRSSSMLNSHNTLSDNHPPSTQDQDCSLEEIDQSSDIEIDDANSEASPLNPGGEGDGGEATDSSLQKGTPNTGSYNKRVPLAVNLRGSPATSDGNTDHVPGRGADKNPAPVQGPTSCAQDYHVLPNKDAISDDASRSQCSLSGQAPSPSEGAPIPPQAADERPRPPHRTASEPQNQVLV